MGRSVMQPPGAITLLGISSRRGTAVCVTSDDGSRGFRPPRILKIVQSLHTSQISSEALSRSLGICLLKDVLLSE